MRELHKTLLKQLLALKISLSYNLLIKDLTLFVENQEMIEKRLPVYLSLPIFHHAVMIEPMLTAVDLRPFIEKYKHPDGRTIIEHVSAGGESGPDARVCDFAWVEDVRSQCKENGISFYYHQTGAKLIKDGKLYNIPRKMQHSQAHKAGLDT